MQLLMGYACNGSLSEYADGPKVGGQAMPPSKAVRMSGPGADLLDQATSAELRAGFRKIVPSGLVFRINDRSKTSSANLITTIGRKGMHDVSGHEGSTLFARALHELDISPNRFSKEKEFLLFNRPPALDDPEFSYAQKTLQLTHIDATCYLMKKNAKAGDKEPQVKIAIAVQKPGASAQSTPLSSRADLARYPRAPCTAAWSSHAASLYTRKQAI